MRFYPKDNFRIILTEEVHISRVLGGFCQQSENRLYFEKKLKFHINMMFEGRKFTDVV